MPFAIPMVWRGGKDLITDCYFCMINLKGINCKNKCHFQYPNVPSAITPILHGPNLPVPEPDGNMEYSSDSEHCNMTVFAVELNNLTWDMNLSKDATRLQVSLLKEKHLPAPLYINEGMEGGPYHKNVNSLYNSKG